MRNQGFSEEVVIVAVRNRGRMAISVEDVSAETEDGWAFQRAADPENPALPHRLEPGAKESWHVELSVLQRVVDGDGKSRKVRMRVELGTGKVLRTKETTLLIPSGSQ
jgi:hypothetical protein